MTFGPRRWNFRGSARSFSRPRPPAPAPRAAPPAPSCPSRGFFPLPPRVRLRRRSQALPRAGRPRPQPVQTAVRKAGSAGPGRCPCARGGWEHVHGRCEAGVALSARTSLLRKPPGGACSAETLRVTVRRPDAPGRALQAGRTDPPGGRSPVCVSVPRPRENSPRSTRAGPQEPCVLFSTARPFGNVPGLYLPQLAPRNAPPRPARAALSGRAPCPHALLKLMWFWTVGVLGQ